MPDNIPSKWYYGIVPVIISLLTLGPFAFGLLWKSPRFNFLWKIILTAAFTLTTVYMVIGSWQIYSLLINQINELKSQGIL